jgi:putative Holliday junction resolvase
MKKNETANETTSKSNCVQTAPAPEGRILCLDLGARRIGVAVSDEMQLAARPCAALARTNWKKLLSDVRRLCEEFDARALVIGLPLALDGTEGDAAREARRLAHNFARSLALPILLQDEQLTTQEAFARLREKGLSGKRLQEQLDGEAAAQILRRFLAERNHG